MKLKKLKKLNQNFSLKKILIKPLLKNNILNQKQFKFRQLFENIFLFKNKKFNVFEFNKLQTILHPAKYKISKFNKKFSSSKLFLKSNRLFLNFRLNFFIIKNFNRLKLKQVYNNEQQNSYVIGRIIKQKWRYTKILLSVFGVLFVINTRNLHKIIDKLMRNKFVFFKQQRTTKRKKRIIINKYFKLNQGRKMLHKYLLKRLRFKIIPKINKNFIFSRREYLRVMRNNNKKIRIKFLKQKKNVKVKIFRYINKLKMKSLKKKKNVKKLRYKYKNKKRKKNATI